VTQSTQLINLEDTAKPQKIRVKPKDVKTLTIQITQLYPGSSQTQLSVAMAEIEFRRFKH
jgi:hypothetical protein